MAAEIIHKKDSHEFPDKIILAGEGLGGEERVVLTIKAFTGSILKYCFAVFALSNLTMNVKFLTERKRSYLIFSYDSQHFGCIIHVYSRAFDCVSQKTSYLID